MSIFAVVFGAFLGLCIVKFGNPVILDRAIAAPANLQEALVLSWPDRWADWALAFLAVFGVAIGIRMKPKWPQKRRLWVLPAAWFFWQIVSAMGTVDANLTAIALRQFAGCLVCYFASALLFGTRRLLQLQLIGLLAGFAFCLVRAADQRVFEFPREERTLLDGERTGWTNFDAGVIAELKQDQVIIATNGVDRVNPFILAKYRSGRVHGTLMYPNALAGAVLLLWPAALALAFCRTAHFHPWTRLLARASALLLGGAVFFWTGSKLAWLIAVGSLGVWLLRLDWPRRRKIAAATAVIVMGMGIFAVRFHGYFAQGAKSAGARFDYWQVGARIIELQPWTGTGPGTFQRPYSRLKEPGMEMARLAHNDFLEQFSDSGIPGGLFYLGWIALALTVVWGKVRRGDDPLALAVFGGLAAWFLQGFGEFGLYIPGLAWPAFTLLGWCLSARIGEEGPALSGNFPDPQVSSGQR